MATLRRNFYIVAIVLSTALSLCVPAAALASDEFIVLCYHDVIDELHGFLAKDRSAVGTQNLVDHFTWLKTHGYHVVSVDDIISAKNGKKKLPNKAVLITFDDGYRSMYTKVYPLLKLFRYPATLAVMGKWMDQADAGKKKIRYGRHFVSSDKFLTWKMIREMSDSGLVEIASHSYDLHRGVLANPQGNIEPSVTTLVYSKGKNVYETPGSMRKRIRADLRKSASVIEKHTGKQPRVIVWPYGRYNSIGIEEAGSAGMTISYTLADGANNIHKLDKFKRLLVYDNPNLDKFAWSMRNFGKDMDPTRVVQIDLDYVYDPDPVQQKKNLDKLVERIYQMRINTVYLQAFADPNGDGAAEALYFHSKYMPMRADLFNRVAWQLKTRAGVSVFAWMPVLAFRLPDKKLNMELSMREYVNGKVVTSRDEFRRLSPFNPKARRIIKKIYEELAMSAEFEGVLFHDGAFMRDTEDASRYAIRKYKKWGFKDFSFPAVLGDPNMLDKWTRRKTEYLADFTDELARIVRKYRPEIRTARNIYARPILEPKSERWYAQSLDVFMKHYDQTALMAMPFMEKAEDPDKWLANLIKTVSSHPNGLKKVIFELQSVNWVEKSPISEKVMLKQMATLQAMSGVNYGYYPDNFIEGFPKLVKIKKGISVENFPYKDR